MRDLKQVSINGQRLDNETDMFIAELKEPSEDRMFLLLCSERRSAFSVRTLTRLEF